MGDSYSTLPRTIRCTMGQIDTAWTKTMVDSFRSGTESLALSKILDQMNRQCMDLLISHNSSMWSSTNSSTSQYCWVRWRVALGGKRWQFGFWDPDGFQVSPGWETTTFAPRSLREKNISQTSPSCSSLPCCPGGCLLCSPRRPVSTLPKHVPGRRADNDGSNSEHPDHGVPPLRPQSPGAAPRGTEVQHWTGHGDGDRRMEVGISLTNGPVYLVGNFPFSCHNCQDLFQFPKIEGGLKMYKI